MFLHMDKQSRAGKQNMEEIGQMLGELGLVREVCLIRV